MKDIAKKNDISIVKKIIDFTYDTKRFYDDISDAKDDVGAVKTKKAVASLAELSARKDIRKAEGLSEEISIGDTVSFIEKRREEAFYDLTEVFTDAKEKINDSFESTDVRSLLFTETDEALITPKLSDKNEHALEGSKFLSDKEKVNKDLNNKFISDKEFLSREGKFISEEGNKESSFSLEEIEDNAYFRDTLLEPLRNDKLKDEKPESTNTTPERAGTFNEAEGNDSKIDDFGGRFLPNEHDKKGDAYKENPNPKEKSKGKNEDAKNKDKAASLRRKAATKTAVAKGVRFSAAVTKDAIDDSSENYAVFDLARQETLRGVRKLGLKAAKRVGAAVSSALKNAGAAILNAIAPAIPVIIIIITVLTLMIMTLGIAGIFAKRVADRDEGIIDDIYYESDGTNVSFSSLTEDEINEALINAETEGAEETVLSVLSYCLHHVGDIYNQDMRFADGVYDCSSYVYRAYKEVGIDISYFGATTAAEECRGLENNGKAVEAQSNGVTQLKPGDLIFYSYDINGRHKDITHVAIYVGGGMICDARGVRYGVVYRTLATRSIMSICRPAMDV